MSNMHLIKRLHHRILMHRLDRIGARAILTQPEDTLHHAQLRRRRILPTDPHPIIHHAPGAHDRAPPIHTARHQRHLQQTAQLVLIARARLGMHEPPPITQTEVTPDQHVLRDRLPEDLDAEHVRDELLRLALHVRMHERDVVVARDDVAQRAEALLDALDPDGARQRVAQVLQLLVGGGGGHEEAVAVPRGEAADDARARDGGGDEGEDVRELGLEDGVEGLGGARAEERVRVGQGAEDADFVAVFEGGADGHGGLGWGDARL